MSGDAARARELGRRPGRGPGYAGRGWPLWAGLVGGPAAWAIAVGASYVTVPVACDVGTTLPLHAIRVVTTAAALGSTWLSYGVWRESRGAAALAVERTAFLGLLGVVVSAFSAVLIVLEGVANFVIDPCR